MDASVHGGGSVGGFDDSKGVEIGAKKPLVRGDVKGDDVVFPFEHGEHRVLEKKRSIYVGGHTGLPNRGKK